MCLLRLLIPRNIFNMKFWTKVRKHGWEQGIEYACFEFPDGTSHAEALKEVDKHLASNFQSRVGAMLSVVPNVKKSIFSFSFKPGGDAA